ncbi:hypothetical protein C8F04DRAFT_1067580 [Mycena alexandri]|uniref:Uncharacterized protein n=1 Tax=Mycena alexandri TaxID=1745969 RepID=A0AAD6TIW5_9AGAR|nr:hypothetical protein C8F04DRAFT_1067580 [Mycena alexandri]
MPVTFTVVPHPANPVSHRSEGFTAEEFLAVSCEAQYQEAEEILQCVLSHRTDDASGHDLTTSTENVVPNDNGFVRTVIAAYNDHHALIIRPDDVWLAILSQFNFFVNANAELLRASFVAHEGKRQLEIVAVGTRYSVDFGDMSRQMVGLIEKNVVDPSLRDWVLPKFTTTTVNDITVSAVLMMATLSKYFSPTFHALRCGIPRVTLEGEKSDWVNILSRLEKLKEYGVETIAWYHLLHPVITRFVFAFDAPASDENVSFWGKVAHFQKGGSGPSYYSGWINAFNVFSPKGKWLGHDLDMTKVFTDAAETLPAEQFWAAYAKPGARMDLVFDGSPYHRLDSTRVPPGYAEVDIKLNDNEVIFDCAMVAGTVGTQITSSDDFELSSTGKDDVVRPVVGWWMLQKALVGPEATTLTVVQA